MGAEGKGKLGYCPDCGHYCWCPAVENVSSYDCVLYFCGRCERGLRFNAVYEAWQ